DQPGGGGADGPFGAGGQRAVAAGGDRRRGVARQPVRAAGRPVGQPAVAALRRPVRAVAPRRGRADRVHAGGDAVVGGADAPAAAGLSAWQVPGARATLTGAPVRRAARPPPVEWPRCTTPR